MNPPRKPTGTSGISRGRPLLGRGDLVDALASGQPEVLNAVARQLGLEFEQTNRPAVVSSSPSVGPKTTQPPTLLASSAGYPNRDRIEAISIWLPMTFATRGEVSLPQGDRYHRWNLADDTVAATPRLLTSWKTLGPRLRQSLISPRPSLSPDIRKLIDRVARREVITHIPRKRQRRWGPSFQVIRDTSLRLATFEPDQDAVIDRLDERLPAGVLQVASGNSPSNLWLDPEHGEEIERVYRLPPPGSQVLVLGDLGCFSRSPSHWRQWYRWGQKLTRQGCHLLALVPCDLSRVPDPLTRLFSLQTWEPQRGRSVGDPIERERWVDRLLVLASPTIRLEPGLLRDLRLLMPEATDASLEVDVWNSEALSSDHPVAASIDRRISNEILRPKFDALPKTLRRRALRCIRDWRVNLRHAPEIWFEEILCLSEESQALLSHPSDLEDARASVRELDDRRKTPGKRGKVVEAFLHRLTQRVTPDAERDPEVGHLIRDAQRRLHPGDDGLAAGTDPREIPGGESCVYRIRVQDRSVDISADSVRDPKIVFPAATSIRSTNQHFQIIEQSFSGDITPSATSFWRSGYAPDAVSDFGTDRFGAWFEFEVTGRDGQTARQRMRWIPAGNFLMGSPEDEVGRDSDEGPQHWVSITRGFWMADTPCAQEMWRAARENDPSSFQGNDLPVENVSWHDAVQFCKVVSEQIPGLGLRLPTEAQWEYACRAGTSTRYWFGDEFDPAQVNCESKVGQTSLVNSHPANPRGLFDMHGNVWEWCADYWLDTYVGGKQTDPRGPSSGSARVIRGGSWFSYVRGVRAASRSGAHPGGRNGSLGFRCLSSVAEPSEAAAVPVSEQGTPTARLGGAENFSRVQTIRVATSKSTRWPSPERSRRGILTDVEELWFERIRTPEWATAFGQDSRGVYADLEVRGGDSTRVCQRLRWIPPGRFRMGSPTTEPGRRENETEHEVILTRAFWIFDSPCRQSLWQAVMGNNPSRFSDPDRPVEKVDWDQANAFAERLTEILDHPDLNFRLPTESQWEYACRAGTHTAVYSGELEILGDANAPALDTIAWYGGNSGHQYDLEEAQEITKFLGLSEKQFDFDAAGTRKVKQRNPNPWGLYEMLGNVWEWCSDWFGGYADGPLTDPRGPSDGSGRVIRGGSWLTDARGVRAACRVGVHPGDRYADLGFRCLSSVKSGAEQPTAEQGSATRSEPTEEAAT